MSRMSVFEEAVLPIYQWQMIAGWVTVVIALIAIFPAMWGLFQLINQVKINRLNTLLILEQDMSRRRDRVSELSVNLKKVEESDEYKNNKCTLDPVISQWEEAVENYLNSLDRLCFCIIRNDFSEKDLRPDYRDVLKSAVVEFEHKFGPSSSYRHILTLHGQWSRT